jgi:hypothetical protein
MNRRGFLKAGATLGILAVTPAKPALGKTPWGAYAEVYNAANEFVGRVGLSLVNNPDGFTMYYIFHAVRNELHHEREGASAEAHPVDAGRQGRGLGHRLRAELHSPSW